jgi:polyhydroxybutyrate depolymerase
VTEATARWRELAGCSAPQRRRAGRVTTLTATGCRTGGPVTLITLRGGGHVWYGPDDALDATEQLRRFMTSVIEDR